MLRKLRLRQKKNGILRKEKTYIWFFKFYHNFVIVFSKIIFFRPLLLNRTNLLLISEMQTVTPLLKSILSFICLSRNNIFDCHNQNTLKLITRLPLVLIHLRFKYLIFFLIPFCIVPYLHTKEKPSWAR